MAPFLLLVSVYGWLSLPCSLEILFLFFCFLALTYYFLMSYLSAGFVSGVYRSLEVTIIFFYGELSVFQLFLMVLRSCAYKVHSCPNFSNIFVTEYLFKSDWTILRKIKITRVHFTYFKDLYIYF